MQGVGEIASLTIDVHILTIETGPAFAERFVKHGPHLCQKFSHLCRGQAFCGGEVVQARPPERLIGVDVPDSTDQLLIEQCSLDVGVFSSERCGKCVILESGV
jgi:hypothetical protein